MSFDADKISVVETWNQFVGSLSSAFVSYYSLRKVSGKGHPLTRIGCQSVITKDIFNWDQTFVVV